MSKRGLESWLQTTAQGQGSMEPTAARAGSLFVPVRIPSHCPQPSSSEPLRCATLAAALSNSLFIRCTVCVKLYDLLHFDLSVCLVGCSEPLEATAS